MNYFDEKAATWDANPFRIERARAVARGILASVPLGPGTTALEYGCGTGLLSFALQPHLAHITLADSSSGMLAVLEEKIAAGGIPNMTALLADFSSGPLPQSRFGLIYTLMTLHHILDTDKILADFYSLLESPSYLCVADLEKEDGSFHDHEFSGHNGFDRQELAESVRRAGFQTVEFRPIFEMVKGPRSYPLFLMVAKKA